MLQHLIHALETLQHWFAANPSLSLLAFAALFVLIQLCLLPGSPLALAAGFFFGFGKGWIALYLGCIFAATLNYYLARTLARHYVRRKLGRHEKFHTIERAIDYGGWKIVLLLRFVPIPFGFASYCYGLTPIRYLPYITATALAIIPANSLFVWMGSTFQGELAALLGKGRPHHPLEYAILILGILAGILALRYATKIARTAVAKTQAI